MKRLRIKTVTRKWENRNSGEKRSIYKILSTILIFFLFWASGGFLAAIGMVAVFWSFYFVYRTIRYKDTRILSIFVAICLFFVGGMILPPTDQKSTRHQSDADADARLINENKAKIEAEKKEQINKEVILKEVRAKTEKQRKAKEESAQQLKQSGDLYKVVGITDGDTIKVSINGVTESIRFIGMDTPETKDPRKPIQCFGKESTSRMQHYAQSKKVRLESDSSQGDRDKYGRLLRYVYAEDGRNIAYEMIKGGYAHEYTYNLPYKYQNQFKNAEQQARESNSGLWAADTCGGDTNQQNSPTPTPRPAPKPTPQPQTTTQPEPTQPSSSVYYRNCSAARAAGAAPVYAGQPGYGTHLDRDRDGVGCE